MMSIVLGFLRRNPHPGAFFCWPSYVSTNVPCSLNSQLVGCKCLLLSLFCRPRAAPPCLESRVDRESSTSLVFTQQALTSPVSAFLFPTLQAPTPEPAEETIDSFRREPTGVDASGIVYYYFDMADSIGGFFW
jgi:hypothetical protein